MTDPADRAATIADLRRRIAALEAQPRRLVATVLGAPAGQMGGVAYWSLRQAGELLNRQRRTMQSVVALIPGAVQAPGSGAWWIPCAEVDRLTDRGEWCDLIEIRRGADL